LFVTQTTSPHHIYMERALNLARRAEGFTSPNPMVGAVVVANDYALANDHMLAYDHMANGRIVGEGYHRQAGGPHAEVEALQAAGEAARGATMYVSLEPCNHYGRTPPCTKAIIEAGISQVYYAVADPYPPAKGGHQALAAAGIDVQLGPCTAAARQLNRFFLHYVRCGRPYVIAKFATSLDGKIATHTGHSQWITGPEARQRGHHLRQAVDAILVGAGTAVADDPQLTTRLPQTAVSHPLRVLLDSRGRVPLTARLFNPDLPGQTVVATTRAMPASHRHQLEAQGVWVWELDAAENGRVCLHHLLERLGRQQVLSLLVEGGSQVLGAFFAEGLVHEVQAFLAPLLIGGQAAPGPLGGCGAATLHDAWRLDEVRLERVGDDVFYQGQVVRSK
jgi:diaminohydroxyphosphoribosylaminopyrimidine deaminase / 5-amino-6-(5-phosphoribosylamino)uracil reductase